MLRIFLAHASEDNPAVTRLYHQLKGSGYQPWLDKVDLLPGQSWRAEIPKAIKNSDVFIACLSQQSVKKQGYIQREFRMALNHMADRPPGQIFLIPVRIDKCEIPDLRQEEYGISLSDYQWVNLSEPDGYDRLVQGIRAGFADKQVDKQAEPLQSAHKPSLSVSLLDVIKPSKQKARSQDVVYKVPFLLIALLQDDYSVAKECFDECQDGLANQIIDKCERWIQKQAEKQKASDLSSQIVSHFHQCDLSYPLSV